MVGQQRSTKEPEGAHQRHHQAHAAGQEVIAGTTTVERKHSTESLPLSIDVGWLFRLPTAISSFEGGFDG